MSDETKTRSVSPPDDFASPDLVGLLRRRALLQAERLAYTFLVDGETDEAHLTFGELDERARAIGATLQECAAGGERALLLYPAGLEYLCAFFGCLYGGVVAVPAYPPRPNRSLERIRSIIADAQPTLVLATSQVLNGLKRAIAQAPELEALRWVATDEIANDLSSGWRDREANPGALAFIQYTSGSTATPKGVMVSHGNFMHNAELMHKALESGEDTTFVSWLPLYHDMGLIGSALGAMYAGCRCVLMSPVAFLQRPQRWLQAISRYRGVISGAPNFAYDLCARKITREQAETLDLTSWGVAFNGAEPVRHDTLERFADAFLHCGFDRKAFYPAYGLAEATLFVSGGTKSAEFIAGSFDEEALKQGRVTATDESRGGRKLVSSGHLRAGQSALIVDHESMKPCAENRVGEIWLAGESVAQGYWNRPEETERTFRARLAETGARRFLRTGDLGFIRDGQLFVSGRVKDLIIIRGRNYYPQDIELTVEHSHAALQQRGGAVFSIEHDGEERLVVVHEVVRNHRPYEMREVVAAIRERVAEQHDIEVHEVVLIKSGSLPKTSSGKVRRFACREKYVAGTLDVVSSDAGGRHARENETPRPIHADSGDEPAPDGRAADLRRRGADRELAGWVRGVIIDRVAASMCIAPESVPLDKNFSSLGVDSVRVVEIVEAVAQNFGISLPPTALFESPTVNELTKYLARQYDAPLRARMRESTSQTASRPFTSKASTAATGATTARAVTVNATAQPARDARRAGEIAVVGMACRFPQSDNLDAFWQLLREGRDAIGEVPAQRWDWRRYYDECEHAENKTYSRWGGFLDRIEYFDPLFFNISPREARLIDPQQRLFLETAWETLEHAGYGAAGSLSEREVGVFVGASNNSYYERIASTLTPADHSAGISNQNAVIANRVSFFLNLRGPSVVFDTLCSSSLVALHMACQSLRAGECTMALAGGVNLLLSPEYFIGMSRMKAYSRDGRCKAFDHRADGIASGEGVAAVLLKPLEQALQDGDKVYAVIKGSAVNHGGHANGLTAPNPQAHADLITRALDVAGVSADSISYVEAHGTGTPLGDPIEVEGLTRAFRRDTSRTEFCAIGSVKTNLGHLEPAAGIAGVIKTILSMQHRQLPPSLHFEKPNQHIPFPDTPFKVNTKLRAWEAATPRRAGVSSFGMGGTNAHVILEEAPEVVSPVDERERPLHLLALSARSENALRVLAGRYASLLADAPEISLPGLCFTANTGRSHFAHRLTLTADNAARAREHLLAFNDGKRTGELCYGHFADRQTPRVAFLFTGQGAQYDGMGGTLYETELVFRETMNRCDELLRPHLEESLVSLLYDEPARSGLLNETAYTQPALFALEYSLAQLWLSWGVEPDALLGHSIGEYVAACLAGVFGLEDALRLVALRGRLIQSLPESGGMAVVFADRASVEETIATLSNEVVIAALNGPRNTVISGSSEALRAASAALNERGFATLGLDVSHAFHSPLMNPILDEFEEAAKQIEFAAPRLPLISNLTGRRMEAGFIPGARYWRSHLRDAVRFGDGVQALAEEGCQVFIELGPQPVLVSMGKRCLPGETHLWLPSLKKGSADSRVILQSLGALYVRGVEVDWNGFDRQRRRIRMALPSYPFERKRYWVETSAPHAADVTLAQDASAASINVDTENSPSVKQEPRISLPERPPHAADHWRKEDILSILVAQMTQLLHIEASEVDVHASFLEMGADSLALIKSIQTIEDIFGVKLSVRQYFEELTTPDALATYLKQTLSPEQLSVETPAGVAPVTVMPVAAAPETEAGVPRSINLLEAQKQLWLTSQMGEGGSTAYNESVVVELKGLVDWRAMRQAFQSVVNRHEALRTAIDRRGETQHIRASVEFDVPLIDFSGFEQSERDAKTRAWLLAESDRAFDLAQSPLLRVHGLKLESNRHLLVVTAHHVVVDGLSLSLMLHEVGEVYSAECRGEVYLPEAPVQFSEYVEWQSAQLRDGAWAEHESYWLNKFSNSIPVLEVPADRPRPPLKTFNGARHIAFIDRDLFGGVVKLGRQNGCTPFVTLLAVYVALLHRLSQQDDMVIGIPVWGRSFAGSRPLVGYCAHVAPLRSEVTGNPTFKEHLASVRRAWLEADEHRDYPFATLVNKLNLPRDPSHAPLISTLFNLNRLTLPELSGLEVELILPPLTHAKFDLSLNIIELDDELRLDLEYNTDIFNAATAESMLWRFTTLVESVVADPLARIAGIPLLTPDERRHLLAARNNTRADYPREKCLHQLFEAQAERTPEAVAAVFDGGQLTYRELNRRANQLAAYLRRAGAGCETLVGLYVERSPEMLVGLLGILKAGAAYVPLDPSFPPERINFMLEDSRAAVLLTQAALAVAVHGRAAHVIRLDSDWQEIDAASGENQTGDATSENLAYVIYTSGSTGRPKGVEVTHRAVVNLLHSMRGRPGIAQEDTLLAVTTLSFDIAALELFLPLTVGARVVVASRETASDATLLRKKLASCGATLMQATPASWRMLVASGWRNEGGLKILCGGEALPRDLATQLLKGTESFWNLYGPTETTIWSALLPIKSDDDSAFIGMPIANTQIYLLDGGWHPVCAGVIGEVYIGGDGLARGYLRRPELTAEKFIPDPFSGIAGARLYRTGDLARYRSDGRLEFLGRADQQVKVRGYRIELGEVETALSRCEGIAQAVVTVQEVGGGDKRLVAYVVMEDGQHASVNDLRRALGASLPEYMMPSTFIKLDAMPLTPNGKVNRHALPTPERMRPITDQPFVAPRTPAEETLAGLWTDVLGVERVGIHDNFFTLGGNSLLGTLLVTRLRETLRVEMPLRRLFERPTVSELAESLASLEKSVAARALTAMRSVERDGPLLLSFAQQRLWFLNRLHLGSHHYNINAVVKLKGQLDVSTLEQAFTEIVRRHEALRTNFTSNGTQPRQIISPPETFDLAFYDLTMHPPETRESEARRRVNLESQRPFNLTHDKLLRASLLRLDEDEHWLAVSMHHIVSDMWSMGVFVKELTALYESFLMGLPSPLKELPVQYVDFAHWQRQTLQGEVLESLLDYWRQQLGNMPPPLSLPTGKPRPADAQHQGAQVSLHLPASLVGALSELSRRAGVTLFMTLLAAFQALLSRLSHQDDIVVGTDIANRQHPSIEPLIGFFVNLLVLRTDLSGNPSFLQLLGRVKEVCLGAYAHQDMPFDRLVMELAPRRESTRAPLFDVLFVMQNAPMGEMRMGGIEMEVVEAEEQVAKFEMAVFAEEERGGEMRVKLNYSAEKYEGTKVRKMAEAYERILESVVREPEGRIREIEMETEQERALLSLQDRQRQESKISKLKNVKRKRLEVAPADLVKTDQLTPGDGMPLVVEPAVEDLDLSAWASSNRALIQSYVLNHGAVLFRNFNVSSIAEFERCASAISPDLFDGYGDLPREEMGGKVYGSTPYPPDQAILFHNESSHLHRWPMKLFFYCVRAAQQGGETPIVDCRRVYELLPKELRERFAAKKLTYIRNYTEGLDVSWEEFFDTKQRSVVEEKCRAAGIEYEWKEGNRLQTRKKAVAVTRHPQTQEWVFFNQLQLHHGSCLDGKVRQALISLFGADGLPRHVQYGDGTEIEDDVMAAVGETYRRAVVTFKWEPCDVLLLDNMLTAHGRYPFAGERKIVVAMGEIFAEHALQVVD